jgi:hypothetical protein
MSQRPVDTNESAQAMESSFSARKDSLKLTISTQSKDTTLTQISQRGAGEDHKGFALSKNDLEAQQWH